MGENREPALQLRSTRSKDVVAALMRERPGIQSAGFGAALRAKWPDNHDIAECSRRIVPDAFEFHDDLRMVSIIEVVDTHPIRPGKAQSIAAIHGALEGEDWNLTVVVFNACGDYICELPGWAFLAVYIGENLRDTLDVLPLAREAARA